MRQTSYRADAIASLNHQCENSDGTRNKHLSLQFDVMESKFHICWSQKLWGVYSTPKSGASTKIIKILPVLAVHKIFCSPCLACFYRAMHFSAYARYWDRMSSVRPSVCLSVTLVICDHIGWKSWKLVARTISPTPSLIVAKRRSTYSQGNMGKFGGD